MIFIFLFNYHAFPCHTPLMVRGCDPDHAGRRSRSAVRPLFISQPFASNPRILKDLPFGLTRAITRTMIGPCYTPLSLAPRDALPVVNQVSRF